jgi:hypothetical protein
MQHSYVVNRKVQYRDKQSINGINSIEFVAVLYHFCNFREAGITL